jgi:hypothetical protein
MSVLEATATLLRFIEVTDVFILQRIDFAIDGILAQ